MSAASAMPVVGFDVEVSMDLFDGRGVVRFGCRLTVEVECLVCGSTATDTQAVPTGCRPCLMLPQGWQRIDACGVVGFLCPEHAHMVTLADGRMVVGG